MIRMKANVITEDYIRNLYYQANQARLAGDAELAIHLYLEHAKYMDIIPPHYYNTLGCLYNEKYMNISGNMSDIAASLKYFEKASDIEPSNHLYAKNGTIMAMKFNNKEKGRKFWDRVFATGELTNDDKYDYAAYCLKNKDFEGWYKYFGYRFKKETDGTIFPEIHGTEWTGEQDLTGKTLLVMFEQGFGDTILMFGYMERLTKLAKKVIFVLQNNLVTLLENNEYGVEVYPFFKEEGSVKFDYYIPSMSIPIALKVNEKTCGVGHGFIKVSEQDIKDYAIILNKSIHNKNDIKIGLSVRGNLKGDRTRDIDVKDLKSLTNIKGITFYNMTKDLDENSKRTMKRLMIEDISVSFKDFKDTAAAMMNMDAIVTTDNVLLNLAGALGRKTFGLFNWSNQFRWFDLDGDNVVWLDTVKPFVCDKQNDWSSPIKKVKKELLKLRKVGH